MLRLCRSDVMLRIVMLLTVLAVMSCVPTHARSAHHVPLAEHIAKKHLPKQVLF